MNLVSMIRGAGVTFDLLHREDRAALVDAKKSSRAFAGQPKSTKSPTICKRLQKQLIDTIPNDKGSITTAIEMDSALPRTPSQLKGQSTPHILRVGDIVEAQYNRIHNEVGTVLSLRKD